MQSGAAGINKPFDKILKAFVDEAPGLFLQLLGLVPAEVEAEIEPLRPETAPATVFPDYVAVVRAGGPDPILFHAEFQSGYHQNVPRDMARYGGSLAWQYQMPVHSVLVLLRADRAPANIPFEGKYSIGATHTTHPYDVVRLWEVDPAPVLKTGSPRLMLWALLMKSTDAQVRKIARAVAVQEDAEALGWFLTLGGIRYDRNALEGMIGGGRMGFTQAILDGSRVIQEERELAAARGRAQGIAEGMAEGKAEALAASRRLVRVVLRKRFPELGSLPELEAISDTQVLEGFAELAMDSDRPEPIHAAIVAAAKAR